MKRIIYGLILVLALNVAFAGTLREEIIGELPKELSSLQGETEESLEKRFKSKITKIDKGEALYLNYFGKDSDVTIGLKGNKYNYLYVELPLEKSLKLKGLYNKVILQLSPDELKKSMAAMEADHSHDKGRFIVIDLPAEQMKLEFYNNEKKSLRSFVLWPKSEK